MERSSGGESVKLELRSYATSFMKQLKDILVKEIKTNGILEAVTVCSDTAQKLTEKYADENDIQIKRVSLKNRNPKNVPDDYEIKYLIEIEELQQNKKLGNDYESIELVTGDGNKYYRYLKPIFIQAECLNCHGSSNEISESVRDFLTVNYPQDKAKGYKVGELRGAVSIKKFME